MSLQLQSAEYKLRGEVSADDTAIDLTADNATEIATVEANALELPTGFQDFEVFVIGTTGGGTDADTNMSLYGWSRHKNMIYVLGKWSLTLGTQVCATAPWGTAITGGLLVDTITADADYWGCNLVDAAGSNHCARIKFYARGLQWLYAEFENVAVAANEIETCYAGIRAY